MQFISIHKTIFSDGAKIVKYKRFLNSFVNVSFNQFFLIESFVLPLRRIYVRVTNFLSGV